MENIMKSKLLKHENLEKAKASLPVWMWQGFEEAVAHARDNLFSVIAFADVKSDICP